MIYFDNAATTFPKPECVYCAADECQRNYAVNAGRGTYKTARRAAETIQNTRRLLADLTRCDDENKIILAPSATVAMNMVLNGLDFQAIITVYISPFEHNAVARPLYLLAKKYGFSVELLPVDGNTQEFDFEKTHNLFVMKHPDVVILNHISNVTGLILPTLEIFFEAKKFGAITILDAAQSLGLIPINLKEQPIDFLVFAGHKNLYGNFGTGGVIYNCDISLKPFLTGGTGSESLRLEMPDRLPERYEAASRDIVSISALNAALDWIFEIGTEKIIAHKRKMTDYLVESLGVLKSVKLYLPKDRTKHISIVSLTHSEYRPEELAAILDQDFDIAVRSGYHCAPYVHKLIGTQEGGGTVRISLGYFNREYEIDALVNALKELE